jgi:glycosyltransferase involved in cell wall biosynthesis
VEHQKTAMLVPSQDPEAMASAILSLVNDDSKARAIANAGIESVQRYTWPNVRDRLLGVYEGVLTKPGESMGKR